MRLCFHDAVTWNPADGSGGAHACLWVDCPNCQKYVSGNAGLPSVVNEFESLYQNFGHWQIMSRPDYWYLGCKVAADWASNWQVSLNYGWGRTMCNVAQPYWPTRIPSANQGLNAIGNNMVNRLGLSWSQSVALLGCHSMGQAHRSNSGYSGRWNNAKPNSFDASYYRIMLNNPWYHTGVAPVSSGGSYTDEFTTNAPNSLMLPTDIATGWYLSGNCNVTSNSYGCAVNNNLMPIVTSYANSDSAWYSAFNNAWTTLTGFGGDKLTYNEQTNYGDGSYPTQYYNGQKESAY